MVAATNRLSCCEVELVRLMKTWGWRVHMHASLLISPSMRWSDHVHFYCSVRTNHCKLYTSRLKSFVPPVAAAAAAAVPAAAAAESMGSINQSNESSISYPCTVHSAESFFLLPAPRTDVREVVRCDEQRSLEWAIPASAGASRDKFGAKTSQVQPSKRNKSRLHISSSCFCKRLRNFTTHHLANIFKTWTLWIQALNAT